MTAAQRVTLYLRVSTARQAEHDVLIPDQRKQDETYCRSRGLESWQRPSSRPAHRRPMAAAPRSSE